MSVAAAKTALDRLIIKGRVHLYKPIQIAEILHRDRVHGDIDLTQLETYRNASKPWRNTVSQLLVGSISTSSARYQDDVFNDNAIPPAVLAVLGAENRVKGGVVEAYIYRQFSGRFSQMAEALAYCNEHDRSDFNILTFINLFWHNPGLRRSVDKIYEIIVYSLFSALVELMDVQVTVSVDPDKTPLIQEFDDFTRMVIGLTAQETRQTLPARIYRVGVANAADRGLDMFANFGMAIQIKHLSLTPELAESIVGSVTADRIVIVCKASERAVIVSLLNQIGWKARIQSIITETDLTRWYEKAMRGAYGHALGDQILTTLQEQIVAEFPATGNTAFSQFYRGRGYDLMTDPDWM